MPKPPGPWFSLGPGLRARVVHLPTMAESLHEFYMENVQGSKPKRERKKKKK